MHALPQALAPLAAYRQFIVYTLVPSATRPGKTDKFPCDFRSGRVVSAHDASVWTDAQTAIAAAAQFGGQYGVGFVFTEHDPFWFLDIDGAYDGQAWSPIATQLVQALAGAAVEVSSSQKGLHIFGTYSGAMPPHKTKNIQFGLEFYHTGRFVALTGLSAVGNAATDLSHLLPSLIGQFFPPGGNGLANVGGGSLADQWAAACAEGPCPEWNGPADDDKLIERALRSQSTASAFGNKASFADLWNGNVDALARAYPDEQNALGYGANEADSALAQHLAFWTGRDCERIERLMRRSRLARDKWDRVDYLPRTILNCVIRQGEVLTDKAPEPLSGVVAPIASADAASPTARATVTTGATFLTIEQQIELFTGCVYVCDQHRALVPGGVMLKEAQFRVMFGGYSFPMDPANERTSRDAWECFTQSQAFRSPRADTCAFLPDQAPGAIIKMPGQTVVNTYWPIDTPRKVGDVSPFLTHLAKLLPDERDRAIVLSYMAAVVQHKGIKFQWAPLIQGVEGNGKSFLTRCVAQAVGGRYSYFPSAQDLADKFNDWQVGKIFIGVEDIYVPGEQTMIIEALKPMVTNKDQQIQGKGKDKYAGIVCCNWLLNTNHKSGMPINDNSRRYGMFFCAQQRAADLVRDGMTQAYFQNLYEWARGDGYAIVSELLHTYPIPDEFNPATSCQRAPKTTSTAEAIEQSRGGIEQEVLEAIEQSLPGFAGGWISSLALDKLLERLGAHRRITLSKRRDLLESLGYFPHPGLRGGRVESIILPDAGKPRLYVKADSPAVDLRNAADICRAYTAAQENRSVQGVFGAA